MLLELKDIKKSYSTGKKEIQVLKGFSLKVNKGEIIAIMGKSGCGKSTLLNIIGCILSFESGEYLYNNIIINTRNTRESNLFRKEHLGFVVQDFALLNDKNVFHNVELPLLVRKIPKEERRNEVFTYLAKVGMEEMYDHYPNQLSGGEQQRVAIARALISNPDILLADEPTGSLDEENTKIILNLLRNIANSGTSVIIVTHDNDVSSYCDRIIKINNGTGVEINESNF